MLAKTSTALAVITMVMSIPLLLSYNIKYQWFPQGLPFAMLYFGGLLSVYVTPVLLLLEFVLLIWTLLSSNISKKTSVRWNLVGVVVAATAELVFIAARYSPP
jgi:hypothetical protein